MLYSMRLEENICGDVFCIILSHAMFLTSIKSLVLCLSDIDLPFNSDTYVML